MRYFAAYIMMILIPAIAFGEDTVHNFPVAGYGPGGPGACSYCHVTHKTLGGPAAQWDARLASKTFTVYQSSTLQATVGQPTGTTKLCLSCHDGTLAPDAAGPTGEPLPAIIREMLQGQLTLGTDLSDDHPVSFVYGPDISSNDSQIKHPSVLQGLDIKLDKDNELQCTTCHNAHGGPNGAFLWVDNRGSRLCLTCHQPTGWAQSIHATSTAASPAGYAEWPTVADAACLNCHATHSAGSHRLLRHEAEEDNCLVCHNGSVAQANIAGDLRKASAHRADLYNKVHDPNENPATMAAHVECSDCHNPHLVRAESSGTMPGSIAGVSGVTASGVAVAQASYEYEICFKCHSENAPEQPAISRQIAQTNIRYEFDRANPSFHPVEGPGRNTNVPSLLQPMTVNSVIQCTDCHAGDSGVKGPHGSAFSPILVKNYTTADYTTESESAYALCYSCHSRQSIISDSSFPLHSEHIVSNQTPCSACHDAHGISYRQGTTGHNSHLINFDLSIVNQSDSGVLEFTDLGTGHGTCSLKCHGENHDGAQY